MGVWGGDDKIFFASGGNAGKGALTPLTKIRRTLVTQGLNCGGSRRISDPAPLI